MAKMWFLRIPVVFMGNGLTLPSSHYHEERAIVAKKVKAQRRAENKARREREALEFRASLLALAADALTDVLCGWVQDQDLDGWMPDSDAMERLYGLLGVRVLIDGREYTSYESQQGRLCDDWDDMEYQFQDELGRRIEALSIPDLQFLMGMAYSAETIRATLPGNEPPEQLVVKGTRRSMPGARRPSDPHFSLTFLKTRPKPPHT
jgi:hypothetical protein